MIFEQIKKTPKIFFFYLYIVLQFIFYILLYTTNLFVYHLGCYSVIICGLIVSLFICLKYKVKYTYLLVFALLFNCPQFFYNSTNFLLFIYFIIY